MKNFYSSELICDRNSINKYVLRTMLLSVFVFFTSVPSVQACIMNYSQSILLKNAPKRLNDANFMGKVEIVRVNHTREKTIVRAMVEESITHPHFVGKKMMFFYTPLLNICGSPSMPVKVGSRGFAIGRALNLGSDILYVKPYKISTNVVLYQVITENESIDVKEFY